MFNTVLLFPFAAAINLFSTTGLLLFAGLLGNGDLAADIAIIQGSILAVFHSLSANARNLILASGSSELDQRNIFYFRLVIFVPAIIAVFYLANTVIDVSTYLFIGLVLRKCCEWLAELQLANREVRSDFGFARLYILLNTIGFVLLVLSLVFSSWFDGFKLTLYIWAILPMALSINYLRFILGLKQDNLSFSKLIPQMGSTTVIGVSTYIFRVLIVILVGKTIAGQMFTAYAIGGLLSSIYVYALGPTLILRRQYRNNRILFLIVFCCFILGALLISTTMFWGSTFYTPLFFYAIGFSLIGGGVMIFAQHQRLYILQVYNKDVFVPDALANILLIGSIPFAYHLFGVEVVAIFFLLSAILAIMFYIPLTYRISLGCQRG